MNENTLMMVRMRAEELMREARQDRLAARACRAARQTAPAAHAARGPARWPAHWPAHWLATAAARMWPTVTGR
jgi:hypothetical protein